MCGVVPLVSRTVLRLRPSDSCAILGAGPSDRGPLFEMGRRYGSWLVAVGLATPTSARALAWGVRERQTDHIKEATGRRDSLRS
jgi:hypothetical protein